MQTKSLFDPKLMIAVSCLVFSSCHSKINYAEAEKYIRESEEQWAESVVSGDSLVVERILADDFIGIDPDGNRYNKQILKEGSNALPDFISNHLNNADVKFYGNCAVVRGDETWMQRKDSATGRFVWTDTWIYQNGKWKIVAAEDLIAPVR